MAVEGQSRRFPHEHVSERYADYISYFSKVKRKDEVLREEGRLRPMLAAMQTRS
jgi:hypothetical protein